MSRTPRQRRFLIAAILFAAGPLVAGNIAALSRRHDFRLLAMAIVSGALIFVVVASRIVKSTTAIFATSLVAAVIASSALAYVLGARGAFGVFAVALVLSV